MRTGHRGAVALLQATHPLPSAAVTGFVIALAAAAGAPSGRLAALAAAVLIGQFSVGWANDALDADRDRTVGRRDKPVASGAVSRTVVVHAATAALLLDIPLSLAAGWRSGAAQLAAVGWAWLYDLRLKATVASVLPYVVSFGLLPVFVTTILPGSPAPRPVFPLAAVACGVAAHFANTVGDAADDVLTGVRGLPQRLGEAGSLLVAAGGVAVAAVLLVLGVGVHPLPVIAATVAVACAVATPFVVRRSGAARRLAFRLVLLSVGLLVLTFIASGGHRLTA
jgi:4-hydroxybenzoate polyprenyltransferase